MEQIDVRFNQDELGLVRNMPGKVLKKYKCDPFDFSTAVYGVVGVCVGDAAYAFTNRISVQDYYGSKEDVAVFRIEKREELEIKSLIKDNVMINMPVNKVIKEVDIINEQQRVYENNEMKYEVWLTRGVIFILEDDTEISLEKMYGFLR